MDLDAIRARLAACPIPEDARSDWDGTNHYEIHTASVEDYWWLVVPDALAADPQSLNPGDWSATEDGKRLGAVLDYACHYARDVAALLRANEALVKALREMLDSAYPHPVEHPTMTAAWANARSALAALAGAETGAEGGA